MALNLIFNNVYDGGYFLILDYEVDEGVTHIHVRCDKKVDLGKFIRTQQDAILREIKVNSEFGSSFTPVKNVTDSRIVSMMSKASVISGTGPMATVAGSMSQMCIGEFSGEFAIVENGGDIALKTNKKSVISIYAGDNSMYSYNVGFLLKAKPHGYGVCTSAGFGSSVSLGSTDATIVFAREASVSDGLATAIGNQGVGASDEDIVNNALSMADDFREFFDGVVVIRGELFAKVGHIPKLVSLNK